MRRSYEEFSFVGKKGGKSFEIFRMLVAY